MPATRRDRRCRPRVAAHPGLDRHRRRGDGRSGGCCPATTICGTRPLRGLPAVPIPPLVAVAPPWRTAGRLYGPGSGAWLTSWACTTRCTGWATRRGSTRAGPGCRSSRNGWTPRRRNGPSCSAGHSTWAAAGGSTPGSWSGADGRSSASTTPPGPSTRLGAGESRGPPSLSATSATCPSMSWALFDFFFDVGCFQHLDADQRTGAGRGITAVANPGATLLMMAFSRPTPIGSFVEGVSPDDVRAAFPGWDLLSIDDADTGGMDFPMRRMQPKWMRLRNRS